MTGRGRGLIVGLGALAVPTSTLGPDADASTGARVLYGIASPDDGGACEALADVAGIALGALATGG